MNILKEQLCGALKLPFRILRTSHENQHYCPCNVMCDPSLTDNMILLSHSRACFHVLIAVTCFVDLRFHRCQFESRLNYFFVILRV